MSDPAPTYATRAAFDRARLTTSVSAPTHARQSNESEARALLQPPALALPDPRPSFARPAQIPQSDALEPWADLSAFAASHDKNSFLAMRREMQAHAKVQRLKSNGR